jgi:hypothetical protein
MLLGRLRRFAPLALLAAIHMVLLTTAHPTFGQPRPTQDLVARGRQLFEDQQYEESIQTLSGALVRPGNTKAQKTEIYRLLALDYITLNRKDEAEAAVRGLLSLDPDYALPASESPRFREVFSDVKTRWEGEGRPGLVKETEPAPPPVTMRHASPSQVDTGTQIALTARLADPTHRVDSVKLFYRTGSHGPFAVVDASVDNGAVRTSVPPEAVRPPLVEYYLQGVDKGGLAIVSRGDASSPLRVVVLEPSRGWVLPVAIGGGVLVAAGIVVGSLFLAGVFNKSSGGGGGGMMKMPQPMPTTTTPTPMPSSTSQVTVVVGQ